MLPQGRPPNEMWYQFVHFKTQRQKESYSHGNDPEKNGEWSSHNKMGGADRASGRRLEAEDKQQDRNNRQDHQDEINGMNYKFVGFYLLPAHFAESFDKAADQTDRCRPRL